MRVYRQKLLFSTVLLLPTWVSSMIPSVKNTLTLADRDSWEKGTCTAMTIESQIHINNNWGLWSWM